MIEQPLMSWEEAVRWLKSQPDQASLVRDCFYDDPISAAAERYYACSEWRAVQKELPKKRGMALDIGAGRGISSFALAKDGWKVISLEPDASDLVGSGAIRRLASETGVEVEVVNDWGESLPFPAGQFDLVYCRAALHHARDLGRLCQEIARVLKPGGHLLATREHVISKNSDLPIFLSNHPLHRLYGGECAYLLQVYENAIKQSGMLLIKCISPYQSDINMFPETKDSLRARLSSKLRAIPSRFIPDTALELYGRFSNTPGRLYSFIAEKAG